MFGHALVEHRQKTLTWPVLVRTIREDRQRLPAFLVAAQCWANKQALREVHLQDFRQM